MKKILALLLSCFCFACAYDAEVETKDSAPGKVTPPAPQKVTVKAGKNDVGGTALTGQGQKAPAIPSGNDLNGDGEADRLEVITTAEENDGLGLKRQLVVYSGEGADLDAWYTAEDVILSTEHGGMMGDPLESAEIENGTIVIKHFGGSRSKWHYTHRFRWQEGDFQLIGTTVVIDDPCTKSTELDYNLSTGIADYATTAQECKGDEVLDLETITVNFRAEFPAQSMNGFKTGENELTSQQVAEPIYF